MSSPQKSPARAGSSQTPRISADTKRPMTPSGSGPSPQRAQAQHSHLPLTIEKEDLDFHGYPKSWLYDPDKASLHIKTFYQDMQEREAAYAGKGPGNGFMLAIDQDGDPKFHHRQYPSPSLNDRPSTGSAWVYLIKENPDTDKPEFKLVTTDCISEYIVKGWKLWDHPERPIDPQKNDIDTRNVERGRDVQTTDRPYNNTLKLFGRDIEASKGLDSKSDWKPGQPFGPGDTAKSISKVNDLQTPAQSNDQSATSFGHLGFHPRPAQVENRGDPKTLNGMVFTSQDDPNRRLEIKLTPEEVEKWDPKRPIKTLCEEVNSNDSQSQGQGRG
ncbi:hypothetical protein F5Y00DRAFT_266435 [Daldinia vernicosa]|uniref:uncharacterized protein n=1 Tax=Daldinia vernicosa TaxID=114800 RepID=UPI0020075334|nr:uncharacterized protein F5Y00DRAFT_266435 [Daldinia vernicosa]KAI0844607.1 hypothetical protein F5Y00DRAFT_266435 [Daldinia vernicosa]